MSKIESQLTDLPKPADKIFTFLCDFNNFKTLMPPQITNWQSTVETCSFVINGMATIGMRIESKTPSSNIHIVSDGKVPFEFTLDVNLETVDANNCKAQLKMKADVNPFMGAMVSGPLKNFLNMLAEKMKEIPV